MRLRSERLLLVLVATIGFGAARSGQAEIAAFLSPVPPHWSLNLDLPRPAEAAETNDAQTADAPRRELRDNAIRAFTEQRFTDALDALDALAQDIDLTAPLGRARAWSATYLGEDARAQELWSGLVAQGATDRDSLFMAAWHGVRVGAYRDAIGAAQRILAADNTDRDAHLLAALAAWGGGRPAAAERHLVASMRLPDPRPESFLAMAAILAQDGALPEGIGWLRRGLRRVPATERRAWLARAEFAPLTALTEPWQRVLAEVEQADTEEPPPDAAPAAQPPGEPATLAILRLSQFAGDPELRARQIRDEQQRTVLNRFNIGSMDDAVQIEETLLIEQP